MKDLNQKHPYRDAPTIKLSIFEKFITSKMFKSFLGLAVVAIFLAAIRELGMRVISSIDPENVSHPITKWVGAPIVGFVSIFGLVLIVLGIYEFFTSFCAEIGNLVLNWVLRRFSKNKN